MITTDLVTASAHKLMQQAPETIGHYLRSGVKKINSICGDDYALKNPDLLAAFIAACAADFSVAIQSRNIQAGSGTGGDEINGLRTDLDNGVSEIAHGLDLVQAGLDFAAIRSLDSTMQEGFRMLCSELRAISKVIGREGR
jgi:hypothetical protein